MNKNEIEYWGNLKLTLELEGDGYFFYGHGLPSEYSKDDSLAQLFDDAEKSIDEFKNYVENKIIKCGGHPEDWTSI